MDQLWNWVYLLIGGWACIHFTIKNRFRYTPATLLLGWILLSAMFHICSPRVFLDADLILSRSAARAGIAFLIGLWFVRQNFHWVHEKWREIVATIGIFDIVGYTAFQTPLLGAPTISSCYLAASITVVPRYMLAIWIPVIIYYGGSTAKAILIAQGLLWIYNRGWKKTFWFTSSFVGACAVNFVNQFREASFTSRLEHWEMFWNYWFKAKFIVQGFGLGSMEWLGFLIQRKVHHMWHAPLPWLSPLSKASATEYFREVHSDWYQILLELGVVGFVLSVLVFVRFFKNASKEIRYPLIAFAVWGLTYHPLHIPFSAFFLLLVLRQVKRKPIYE